jgi:integrase
MTAIFRRCGCRDDTGKTYGVLPVKGATPAQQARACPTMSTDPKHGSYSWRLSRGFDPATGKRVQVNGGSFTTLKAAQVALNKAKVKKDEGTLAKPTSQTLANYAAEWLPRRQTMGKKPLAATTAAGYKRYIEQDIAPSYMGKKKLSDLKRSDVQAFLDALVKAGRGATTVNRILATVQAILTSAVRDELVQVNVARGVEGPTITKAAVDIWSPDQLAAFLAVASEHRLGALFEVTLHCALRRGEVCGLRWQDIDFDRGVARIANNRVIVGGTTITETTPKTDASAAEVELAAPAVTALEGWKLRQALEAGEWGEHWKGTGHVFTYEDGRALDPSYVTRLFERLRVDTEKLLREQQAAVAATAMAAHEVEAYMAKHAVTLPKLTLHGLRHVAATYMWASGADILAVSKALRHSSPTVTSTVYTHLTGGKQKATFGGIAAQLETATAHTLHTHAG